MKHQFSAALPPGKAVRMQRFWKHPGTVIIPYDHGMFSGAVPGIDDVARLTERIARTSADGILVGPGTLKQIAHLVGHLGVMLRLDGGLTRFAAEAVDYRSLLSVSDAVRLGADAVMVFTFVGTPYEADSLLRLGHAAAEGDLQGVPVASEVLPPSLLNNHFGWNLFRPSRRGDDVHDETAGVTRIAAEAGADIIKTRFSGDIRRFREAVRQCGAKVIVAGGPLRGGGDDSLLGLVRDCLTAGAHGIVFGRNVWQHPRMEKMIAAVCAIVHEGETPAKARKILR